MSFLNNLLERARGLFGDDVPEPANATDVIPHDRFDDANWAEIRTNVPVINTMITDLERKHDYVNDFAQDVFNALTQGDPRPRDVADMATTHVPNHTVVSELAKLPEVQALRASTRHDPYGGAMAMTSMRDTLYQLVERSTEAREAAKAQAEAEQKARDAAAAAQQAIQAAAAAQQAAETPTGTDEQGNPTFDPAAQQALEDAQNAAEQAMNEAESQFGCALGAREVTEQAGQQAVQGMRADLRAAAQQAEEERNEEEQLMRAFGVSDGELQRMPFKERAQLAQRLKTNRMAKFAKLIGQFKALQAAESRRKVQHAPDEVNNVVLGDDLVRLAPSELLSFASDELEDDFWLRYVNRQLLCFDLIGTERVGQGPIVVVCDESGSMQGSGYGGVDLQGGTPEAWSKALSLALCEQARQKGRDFYYIGFSSSRQQYALKFPGGKAPLADVINMTEHFFGGGTSYEPALDMAVDILESYDDKDGKRPDVVFITDDEYGSLDPAFMTRWNKAKAKYDSRCFGIAIGCGASGALSAVADNVRTVTEMTSDPKAVSDLFRTL